MVLSSTLGADGVKADLLANICSMLSADLYLSPPGSSDYLDNSTAFAKRDIDVLYHVYYPPEYGQLYGDFEEDDWDDEDIEWCTCTASVPPGYPPPPAWMDMTYRCWCSDPGAH